MLCIVKWLTFIVTCGNLISAVPILLNHTGNETASHRREMQGCVCTEQYAPVCDATGRVYSNNCVARCNMPRGQTLVECPSTVVGASPVVDALPAINCCGGGAGCGFVHCPALGTDPASACVRPWAMPQAMTWPASCAPRTAVTPRACRLRDTQGACVPSACEVWFDGCNQCMVRDGSLLCTRRACVSPSDGRCLQTGH